LRRKKYRVREHASVEKGAPEQQRLFKVADAQGDDRGLGGAHVEAEGLVAGDHLAADLLEPVDPLGLVLDDLETGAD
jgi:hypothetical protein